MRIADDLILLENTSTIFMQDNASSFAITDHVAMKQRACRICSAHSGHGIPHYFVLEKQSMLPAIVALERKGEDQVNCEENRGSETRADAHTHTHAHIPAGRSLKRDHAPQCLPLAHRGQYFS
jgi:hypothetical protein